MVSWLFHVYGPVLTPASFPPRSSRQPQTWPERPPTSRVKLQWKTPETCQKRGHIFGVLVLQKWKPESRNNAGMCMYLKVCVGFRMYRRCAYVLQVCVCMCKYVPVSIRAKFTRYLAPRQHIMIFRRLAIVGMCRYSRYVYVLFGICWYNTISVNKHLSLKEKTPHLW